MRHVPGVSVIVPAYNEVQRMAHTLGQITAYFEKRQSTCEVIVSTDGNDGTRELVAEMAMTDPFSIRFATLPSAASMPVAEESGVSQDSPGANPSI